MLSAKLGLTVLFLAVAPMQAPENQKPPAPVAGQPLEEAPAPAPDGSLYKVVLGLFILLILLFLAVFLLRRLTGGGFRSMSGNKSIRILERRPLSPKTTLFLVEISGKEILVAESQFEVRALTTIDTIEKS